jgi:HK97 family phage portal protein
MGILSGIGSALRMVADQFPDPNAKRDPSNPMYWADMGTWSVAGVRVTEQKVSQLGAVQAVRYGLSSAMSSLPVMVFRRGKNGARQPLPDHPLSILLGRRPNDRQTPAEFIGEISWHLSYWRNAYCRVVPGDDPTEPNYAAGELEIIHPRRLTRVERRADGYIYYTFNSPQTIVQGQALQPTTYREDEVWHLSGNPLTEDGLLGQPIWESAREVFGRAIAVHEYGDIWFFNSGQTGGIIKHPGNFKDKEDKAQFLETWRSSGADRNRHRDKLLTHGADYTPLKVTNAEAQLLETEKQSDVDVFGLWSYPPHHAGRLDRATFSNIEQQSLDFVVYGLTPVAIAIEQAAERDLLLDNADNSLFVEFNFAALLRGDLRSRYQAYLIGRQGEWLSANDIRRAENMSPRTDEGGDDYKNPLTKDSSGGAGGSADDGDGSDQEQQGTPKQDGNNGK